MRHPGDGLLRRLLDEPDGVADADRDHVDACAACQTRLFEAGADADGAASALRFNVDPDVDAGWQRLTSGLAVAEVPKPVRRWRLRSPLVAVVGVVALLTGASAAAAGDWLQIFRTERVAPVTVPQADLVRLPELDELGAMTTESRPNLRAVEDARSARDVTGLASPRVNNLPQGVSGQPRFLVADRITGVFRFDRATAAKALGRPVPEPPAGLEQSEFRLTAGPGLATVWPGTTGAPALVVGRVVAPKVFSTGVPFDTARDYLLALPGLPASVASQLTTFGKEGTTLPLIVNSGTERSYPAEVGGVPATVLSTEGGAVSVVVWVRDGFVNVVGGSLSGGEVLRVASETRWAR